MWEAEALDYEWMGMKLEMILFYISNFQWKLEQND